MVRYLLASGADPRARAGSGRLPIHLACFGGKTEIVREFIALGVSVDATDSDGRTPLIWACLFGHLSVGRLLVDKMRASLNARDLGGDTALVWAKYAVDRDTWPAPGRDLTSDRMRKRHKKLVKFLKLRDAYGGR